MQSRTGWRFVCFVVAITIAASCPGQAQAYRRRGSSSRNSANSAAARQRQQQAIIQAALAQLNAAKQVLAAAESTGGAAQSKLDAAVAKLRDSSQHFHDAQSTTRHLAKELAETENEILSEQKEDSPYAKATKQVEAARKKLKDVEERILAEQEVQLQLAELTGGKLLDKKRSILELRPDYLDAKSTLDTAASSAAHIRSELFQNDKDWKDAAEALTKARKEEKEAEEKTHSGASGRVGNSVTLRNASEAAAAARAAIAQAEAVIRANGGAKYLNSNTASRNPAPNKNNKNK